MMNPHARHWSRRSALQTLALGAGGVSTLAATQRELRAAGLPTDLALPKRLLIVFSPNGIPERQGWKSWLGTPSGPTDIPLTPITEPLRRHLKDIVFFDNLILSSVVEYGDKHHTASRLTLTGAKFASMEYGKERPTGPSVDQYLAQKVGKTVTPQWPSLELVVQEGASYVSWSAAGTQMPAVKDPWVAYDKLFANLPVDGKVEPDPSLVRRLMLRRSVLDRVAKDIAVFKKRLPPEDRIRADAQLDAVRTLEGRLSGPDLTTPGACQKPALGAKINVNDTTKFPQIMRAMSDVAVAALSCDLTRIALINWRGGGNRLACDFAPINHPEEEHGLSHDFQDLFAVFKNMLNEETAYIADKLSKIPEGDGTMLDNTIILQTTEISAGHGHLRMPWFSLGGKNMGVQVGRILNLPIEVKPDANNYRGYPSQKLFVSLLHAMGLTNEESFGVTDFGKGPMVGYLG